MKHLCGVVLVFGVLAVNTGAQQQNAPPPVPVPRPFPGAGQPPGPAAPAKPAQAPVVASPGQDGGTIDPLLTGIAMYAGAELLYSTEVGRSQRVFVFGTNDPYASVVSFYRTQLRRNGETVSREPAIQQFDVGSFNSSTMDQRPSVIVKDYRWPDQAGYLHAAGSVEKRFLTLIQIIPPAR
jgi:hypothetical protein